MPTHATPVQIIWTCSALVGWLAALLVLVVARLDDHAVQRAVVTNRRQRRYARMLVREAIERLGVFSGMVAIGGIAMFTPPPILAQSRENARAIGGILIVMNVWKTWHVLWTLRDEYWVRLRLWAEDKAWTKV